MGYMFISFTVPFFIFLSLLYYSYLQTHKNNLAASLSGFFSILLLVIFLPLKKLIKWYDIFMIIGRNEKALKGFILLKLTKLYLWEHYVVFLIVTLILSVILIYLILKLLIYIGLILLKFKNFEKTINHYTRPSIFVFTFIPLFLLIVYLSNPLSIKYPVLYTNGYTKVLVDLPLFNSPYDLYFKDAMIKEQTNTEIENFMDLFTSRQMYDQVNRLESSLANEKKFFIKKVYTQESYETRGLLPADQNVFLNLYNDQSLYNTYFKDIKSKSWIASIPIVSQLVLSQKDLDRIHSYQYLNQNKQLILWLEQDQTMEQRIEYFMEHDDELLKNKDRNTKKSLKDLKTNCLDYYYMRDYTIKVMKEDGYFVDASEYELVDHEVLTYLEDQDHFIQFIEHFKKDYNKNQFKQLEKHDREKVINAYQIAIYYLKHKEGNLQKINPSTRLMLSTDQNQLAIMAYFKNSTTLSLLKGTHYDSYSIMDYIIYHDLMKEDHSIDNSKMGQLIVYSSVNQLLNPIANDIMFKNRYGYEDSYIEDLLDQGILDYNTLKELDTYSGYFNPDFNKKIDDQLR